MATKHTNNGGNGTAEISIFALNIKGGEAIVQSAIQQFAKAGFSVALPQTPKPPPVSLPAASGAQPKVAAQTEIAFDQPIERETETVTPTPPSTSERPPRKRTYAVPNVLDELKANEEPDPFKSFAAGRTLESDIDRALTVIMWLKQKRNVVEFRTDHLHTCFEMMPGWKLPEDPSSLLRNMKKRQFVRPIAGKTATFEVTSKGANRYGELP